MFIVVYLYLCCLNHPNDAYKNISYFLFSYLFFYFNRIQLYNKYWIKSFLIWPLIVSSKTPISILQFYFCCLLVTIFIQTGNVYILYSTVHITWLDPYWFFLVRCRWNDKHENPFLFLSFNSYRLQYILLPVLYYTRVTCVHIYGKRNIFCIFVEITLNLMHFQTFNVNNIPFLF